MLMQSRAPAARVYRSRERKNENLRRSYRSARAAQGVMAKKVQRNGSRHIYRLPIKLACEQCTFSGAPAHHLTVTFEVTSPATV
jgi:ribosomal protein L44E